MTTGSWHCHDDILCEWDNWLGKNCIAFIKADKPKAEQELRLRLYQPMSTKATQLLAEYEKAKNAAFARYDKVEQAAEKVKNVAMAKYFRVEQGAWAEYDKVLKAAFLPLEAKHKIECPNCPWDGTTIFPRPRSNKKKGKR